MGPMSSLHCVSAALAYRGDSRASSPNGNYPTVTGKQQCLLPSAQHRPHVPELAVPQESGSPLVYPPANVPLPCVYVLVGIFTEGAVSRQLRQEPSKGQTAGRQDSGTVCMGGTCVSLLFELCCSLGEKITVNNNKGTGVLSPVCFL